MTNEDATPSHDLTVAEYARRVSTSSPTPGGGSVSAVSGALAAGLAGMVCALTLKAKTTDADRARLEPAELSAGELRLQLLRLAVEDEAAYAGYRAAAALPKSTDAEKGRRSEALQTALAGAAETPLTIARTCFDLLELLPVVAELGTAHALSDASASAILGFAALRGALLNVDVNAAMIKDADLAARLKNEAARLDHDGAALRDGILKTIRAR